MTDTKKILNILEELRNTSSVKKKKEILNSNKNFNSLKVLAKYTYDDSKYFVSIENAGIEEQQCGELVGDRSYTDILDLLKSRTITGNAAIELVNTYYHNNEDGILLKIALDHDFRCGVSNGIIKKVWPEIFSTFSVALAEKYDDSTKKNVNFDAYEWFMSRKLDGVRCICIKKNGSVRFFARSGKEFKTLSVLKEKIESISADNFVLDGECTLINSDGIEDFQGIVGEIKRKNHTISNPVYWVFDCLTLEEFYSGCGETKFSERISREVIKDIRNIENVKILDQIKVDNDDVLNEFMEYSAEQGWEGLMIRKNIGYEGKRSKNMLKIKKFVDNEYIIENVSVGKIRYIEDGRTVEYTALSAVDITHKGNTVSVGSGFSKDERIYYGVHPEELIGKTVTVKYFQESVDLSGNYSLRFPTIKYIYNDGKRDL